MDSVCTWWSMSTTTVITAACPRVTACNLTGDCYDFVSSCEKDFIIPQNAPIEVRIGSMLLLEPLGKPYPASLCYVSGVTRRLLLVDNYYSIFNACSLYVAWPPCIHSWSWSHFTCLPSTLLRKAKHIHALMTSSGEAISVQPFLRTAKHIHALMTSSGESISVQPRCRSGSAVRCIHSYCHIQVFYECVDEPRFLGCILREPPLLIGKKFVIATLRDPPLSDMDANGKGVGIVFDFIEILRKKFGFTYTVKVPKENIIGNKEVGVLSMVHSGVSSN
ncbi:unnamed protein product, partial [Timema podura]|nr:unnamed protein product [Timema podura]